jgi:hypothetical protein
MSHTLVTNWLHETRSDTLKDSSLPRRKEKQFQNFVEFQPTGSDAIKQQDEKAGLRLCEVWV